MKPISTVLVTVLLFVAPFVQGQSVGNYSDMENRFLRSSLSAEDSLAFQLAGENKVRQLFERSDLYFSNTRNTSNQAFVKARIPDLFHFEDDEPSDLTPLLTAIELSSRSDNGPLKLKTERKPSLLGVVTTLNTTPQFVFELRLMQVAKQFGERQELVWQVFLANARVLTPSDDSPSKGKVKRR